MTSIIKWNAAHIPKKAMIYFMLAIVAMPMLHFQYASAAACATPSTDYGQVSDLSATIDTAGTYRIWTRMAAPDTTNNSYLLEIDGTTCFTVGGNNVPVYNSGTSTHFANSSANWINTTSGGSAVSMALGVGAHTIKLIGNAPGVVVDRIILSTSATCTPTGTGGNCSDATPPTLSAVTATSVTHQSATITWTTNESTSSRVEYGTTTGYGSATVLDTTLVTLHSVDLASLASGTLYHYRVTSTDQAGNTAVSGDQSFTTVSTTTYLAADINQDGIVGILDVSLVISRWNNTGTGLGRSDINNDGVVNALDLSSVIGKYGQ